MFDEKKFMEKIYKVNAGSYEMNTKEMKAMFNASADTFDIMYNAFRYGFLKGQRCERKQQKIKQANG